MLSDDDHRRCPRQNMIGEKSYVDKTKCDKKICVLMNAEDDTNQKSLRFIRLTPPTTDKIYFLPRS